MRQRRARARLIDLTISEIEIASDLGQYPERGVDHGVVPWAMLEYLRHAESFPVAPTVEYVNNRFRPVEGGLCLRAGAAAGWSKPIRSLIFALQDELPAAVWERTWPFSQEAALPLSEELEIKLLPQVLCFARQLSEAEQARVEAELKGAASQARARGLAVFSEIQSPVWPRADVLCWRTYMTLNPEDKSMALEYPEMLTRICLSGIPITALNGRRFWPQENQGT